MSEQALDAQARAILTGNDRGGFTVPTDGLYPYQWNWDSVFCAMGFACFDEPRAWQELDCLFEAQWPDGMVPHIIFRTQDPGYFPGPDVWGAVRPDVPFPTSGISQPPVAASAVRWMLERASDPTFARRKARALLPKIEAWHRWWHDARDPDGLGIIAISHPWESGRDNLPDWDRPGDAIDVSGVGAYTRRDTGHVDADMRPKKKDYDRYIALVQFGRARGWDHRIIAKENPFWVADVGVTAILLRAERDLAALQRMFDDPAGAAETQTRIARLEQGFERFWVEQAQAFCSYDLRGLRHAESATSASMLCFYAGAGTADQREATLKALTAWGQELRYLCPSLAPDSPEFDHCRYWRGPVWGMMNFMIAQGLEEAGHSIQATRVASDTMKLIAKSGFGEAYSAVDGTISGGDHFSWTAAVWLALRSNKQCQG